MKPKNFLQRVLDYALSELERRARTPDVTERMDVRPRELSVDQSREPAPVEPSREPAPVEPSREPVLVEQPPHQRDETAESESRGANGRAARAPVRQPAPVVRGLEAVRTQSGEGMILRWSIQATDVERARRLVSGKPVLCLRIVSFTKARDDVRREVQDRPGVDLSGECQITDSPERAVVALGLRAGERFISIAHHVL